MAFLCERDVELPSMHALPEFMHSYQDYTGINSAKIRELVRWHDRSFTKMIKQFMFIDDKIFVMEQDLLKLEPFLRRDYHCPDPLLQRATVELYKKLKKRHSVCKSFEKGLHYRFSDNVNAFGMSTTSMFERAKQVCSWKECANCGIDVTDCLKYCGRCKVSCYCSRACQSQHWKQGHKRFCVPVAEQKVERLSEVDSSTKCAVCLENYTSEMKTLKCGHVLHETCVWLVEMFCNAKACPICRASL